MSEAAIEAARTRADAVGEEVEDVPVWAENADIVRVFEHCPIPRQIVAGAMGGGVIYQHITAAEIQSTADMLGVPRERWAVVLWGVRVIETVVLPELNRKR